MGAIEKFVIERVSFSRLMEYENCGYATKLKLLDKIPEPERPLPAGKTEHANDRGTRIHEACEAYVRGKGELPKEAMKFEDEFKSLRASFKEGRVSLEGEWGFTRDWEPCEYNAKTVWLRIKADAVVHISKTRAVVVDYKTGRRFGNEIKHGEQVQLYALALMIRNPDLTHIDVELWYLDQDEITHDTKPVTKWIRHLKPFDARFKRMSRAENLKPRANKFSCKWCPYKGNACEFGVDA